MKIIKKKQLIILQPIKKTIPVLFIKTLIQYLVQYYSVYACVDDEGLGCNESVRLKKDEYYYKVDKFVEHNKVDSMQMYKINKIYLEGISESEFNDMYNYEYYPQIYVSLDEINLKSATALKELANSKFFIEIDPDGLNEIHCQSKLFFMEMEKMVDKVVKLYEEIKLE